RSLVVDEKTRSLLRYVNYCVTVLDCGVIEHRPNETLSETVSARLCDKEITHFRLWETPRRNRCADRENSRSHVSYLTALSTLVEGVDRIELLTPVTLFVA